MSVVWAAIVLGIGAGVTPGPLMAIVVSEAVQRGTRAGVAVSFAPLITDFPIIVVCTLLLRSLPDSRVLFALIGIFGALYLLYLAIKSWNAPMLSTTATKRAAPDLARAVLVNASNPHPYIFWMTVGGIMLRQGFLNGVAAGLVFPLTFYVALIGCKVIIALILGAGVSLLSSNGFRYLNRFAAAALVIFAGVLLKGVVPDLASFFSSVHLH